jgi:CubicO group peptidase (beta-lactamase class C family)
MLRRHWKSILFALIVFAIGGAAISAPYLPRLVYEGFPGPVWPARGSFAEVAGAENVTPLAEALTSAPLDPQLETLIDESGAMALLIVEDGTLRIEHYAEGITATTRLNSYSMVKSLVGALVLKAVAVGRLAGLNQPIGATLANIGDAEFRTTPLRAFLKMQSGVLFESEGSKAASGMPTKDLEGAFSNPFGPLARLHMQGLDAVSHRLSRATAATEFNYQNINTAILGAVLEEAYGQPLQALLSEKIWKPSGAASAEWRRYGEDTGVSAYCCLYATPRDWARVAGFIASNGDGGEAFLPPELWRLLLGQDYDKAALHEGVYGLHLRHDILDRAGEALQGRFTYFVGSGGQIVYLMPEKNLVVVRFGESSQLLHSTLYASWRTLRGKVNQASVN